LSVTINHMNITDRTASAHTLTTTSRPARRRRGLFVSIAAVTLLVAAGCTDEQKTALGELDVQDSLTHRVEQAVEDQGLEVDDDDLACSAEIAADGALTASCSGDTTSAEPVLGSFAGTADIDDETCAAQLVVAVAGATVVDEADVDCFDAR
jgi:hypothetical protein